MVLIIGLMLVTPSALNKLQIKSNAEQFTISDDYLLKKENKEILKSVT